MIVRGCQGLLTYLYHVIPEGTFDSSQDLWWNVKLVPQNGKFRIRGRIGGPSFGHGIQCVCMEAFPSQFF